MDPYREDPEFKRKCDQLHGEAIEAGSSYYLDPQSGLRVSTAVALLKRGYCCDCKCRHCPYGHPGPYEKYLKRKS
ncbi:MAG: hypothetical protein RJB66_1643 [Pseudomonadota bacterium]|jgi:hypothetical protein